MIKTLLCLASLGLLICRPAIGLEFKSEVIEQFDDLRVIAFINDEDITSSPEWRPFEGKPSVGIAGALDAVAAFAGEQLSVEEIEMRPFEDYADHWHYLVKVRAPLMAAKHQVYVVLMSGQVIPAIIEPEAYK